MCYCESKKKNGSEGNFVKPVGVIFFVCFNQHTLKCTLIYIDNIAFQALQSPILTGREANPKTVASIILGGGAGTRLFPLTQRRAKPAVSD